MSHKIIAVLFAATLGQFPAATFGQFPGGGPGASPYGGGAVQTAPNSTHAFGTGDPTYPYDYEPNWMHGYYQDIPAYHGHHFFRPYNYKHVFPQTQAAAAWGIPPQLPISHPNFNSVNGLPPMPPAYHPAPYTGLTQNGPIQAAPTQSGSSEDILSQFSKIERGRTSASRRQVSQQQVTGLARNPNIQRAQYQQPRRLRNVGSQQQTEAYVE
ncbi:MAG: hypothetical protein JWM11_3114 [Planctomycetaceae bacterium]|nr:hypothetical protein [Planctomycetaceae bacterium]